MGNLYLFLILIQHMSKAHKSKKSTQQT